MRKNKTYLDKIEEFKYKNNLGCYFYYKTKKYFLIVNLNNGYSESFFRYIGLRGFQEMNYNYSIINSNSRLFYINDYDLIARSDLTYERLIKLKNKYQEYVTKIQHNTKL